MELDEKKRKTLIIATVVVAVVVVGSFLSQSKRPMPHHILEAQGIHVRSDGVHVDVKKAEAKFQRCKSRCEALDPATHSRVILKCLRECSNELSAAVIGVSKP